MPPTSSTTWCACSRSSTGCPQPDHRQGVYAHIRAAEQAGRTEIELAHFHLRWFRKGTAHLTFKRLDLVDGLNRILAKHYPNALAAR